MIEFNTWTIVQVEFSNPFKLFWSSIQVIFQILLYLNFETLRRLFYTKEQFSKFYAFITNLFKTILIKHSMKVSHKMSQ